MDQNSSWWNVTRKRQHHNDSLHKEHRISKAVIGQPMIQLSYASSDLSATQALSMKCIILQNDKDSGCGLVITGERPVIVNKVTEGGTAQKAGVHEGDRIIKVNGTNVQEADHFSVVQLIKENSSYVALTLLGPATTDSAEQNKSSDASDQLAKMQKVHQDGLKELLQKTREEIERIKNEYALTMDEKLLVDLKSTQNCKQDLEKKLWRAKKEAAKAPAKVQKKNQEHVTDIDEYIGFDEHRSFSLLKNKKGISSSAIDLRQISNSEGTLTTRAINGRSGKRGSSDNIVNCNDTVAPELNSLLESHSMNIQEQNTSILNFEDDELIEEGIADHGPYNELEVLKKKPAHFAVFINYVLSEVDKSGLLLMLTVDTYKNLSSTKDLLKKASEIYKYFFSVESVFKVNVDGAIGESINKLLISKNPSEEALKFMFDSSVQICTDVIRQQLSNFRSVREKGLAHMYGDTYLPLHKSDTIMKAVDEITNKKLNSLLIEKDNAFKMLKNAQENGKSPEDIKIQIERISLIQDVIKTYAEINGYKKKKTVDRIQSIFTRGPKPKVTDKQRKPTGASNSQELTSDDKKKKFFSNTRSERKQYKNKQNRHQLRQMSEKMKSSQQHQVETRSKSAIFTAKLHLSNEKEESCSMMNDSQMINCDVLATSSDEFDTAAVIKKEVASDYTEISDSVCDALTSSSATFLSPDKIQSSTSATDIQSLTQVDQSYSNTALESNRRLNRGGSFRGRGEGKSFRGKTGHSKSDPDPDSVKKAVLYSTSLVSETDGACISISQNIIPTLDGDPDYELPDPLPWHQRVNKNLLKKLSKQEVNKQSNINELIDTEMQHFANLVMINKLFYEPLQRSKIVNEVELYDLFSTLPELVHFHKLLNHNFQAVKKRDGNIVNGVAVPMLDLFEDDIGETFKKQAAKFCANQKKSLRTITELKTVNKKFSEFLEQTHRKNFVALGRLELQDWIPAQFQRLTKYPLMIKGIIKCYKTSSDQNSEEYKNLLKLKEITTKNLLFTDDFIRKTDNRYDLEKIQQSLDRSPLIMNKNVNIDGSLIHTYKDIDLLEDDSIYQGYLKYVIGIKKQDAYDVFVVVYKHLIVLIETNANKQHFLNVLPQKTISQGVGIPFITMSDAVIRRTATDKRAFFMLANNNMYQMLASTHKSRNEWVDVLNKAVTEAQKDKPSSKTPRLKIRPSEFHDNPDEINLTVEDGVVQSDELQGRLHPNVDAIEENLISEPTVVHPTSHHMQRENQIRNDMNNLLQEKRKLIAEMANSDLENLDTVFEISQNDLDVDNKTILLDMILNVDKLDSLMNNSTTADNIYTFPASNSNMQPTNSNLTSRKNSGIPPEDYTNDDRWATPINLDIPKTLPSVVNPPLTTQNTEDVDQSLYERLTTKNKERKAFTSMVEVEKVWNIITTLKSQLHVLLEREMHTNTRNQDDSNENVDIEKNSPPPTYDEVRQEHSEEEEELEQWESYPSMPTGGSFMSHYTTSPKDEAMSIKNKFVAKNDHHKTLERKKTAF